MPDYNDLERIGEALYEIANKLDEIIKLMKKKNDNKKE